MTAPTDTRKRRPVSHRHCRAHMKTLNETIDRLEGQCITLARLAADTPQFFNPLVVFEAQALRDYWLKVAEAKHVSA